MRKIVLKPEIAAVLLDHVVRGTAHPEVGFEDANMTQRELTNALMGRAVSIDVLESALWSCNLMNEVGEFREPAGKDFFSILAGIVPRGMTFDQFFNVFDEVKND